MSTQTIGTAVARRDREDKLVAWLRGQQDDLAMAAASHLKPSTIVRVTQGALRKDDKLMAAAVANPLSLLHCLLDAARLGHEPGTDQYYLVPFGSEVTGVEGYKGIIERMYRAGAVSSVVAEVVYAKDVYHRQGATTPPIHEFDEFADPESRGPLRGAYAYAVMLDGRYSKVIPMGRAEVMKHKAMSRGSDRSDSPWKKWEEPMWKKCPLRGLEPYVPTSSEWLRARAQAAMPAPAVSAPGWSTPAIQAATPEPADVVDAEIVEDTPAPQQRRRGAPKNTSPAATTPPTPPQAEPAGEAPDRPVAMATTGQVGIIRREFERLGYSDSPEDREARLKVTAKLAGTGPISSTNKLTQEQAKVVREQLQGCRDAEELRDLTENGEVPGDGD
jgi:recombination protein RecT